MSEPNCRCLHALTCSLLPLFLAALRPLVAPSSPLSPLLSPVLTPRYPLHDLEKYYLPAFKAAMVDAGAGSVMCAYQGVNGIPMCANGFMLNRVIRDSWGWKGFVVR